MKFRTEIELGTWSKSLDYSSQFVFIGSCFSENIGGKLRNAGFQAQINPCGIIFNPHSLAELVQHANSEEGVGVEELIEHEGLFFSNVHHSSFSGADNDLVLREVNSSLNVLRESLSKTSCVFVTLGTAWVYRHIPTNRIVANCNKIPNHQFSKELLSAADVTTALESIALAVQRLNPQADLFFTVSPVRHWKDGAIENQRSKAHLITAVHAVCDDMDNVHYFPSYEIQMDDLRDYRFYKEDLLHPSEEAVNYIWEKFKSYFFSAEVMRDIEKMEALHLLKQHRSRDEEKQQSQIVAFKEKIAKTLETEEAKKVLSTLQ